MKFAYEIFPEKRLILESFEGNVAADELFSAFQKVWKDSNYQRSFSGISDLTQADFKISLADFRELEDKMYGHPLKCQGRWVWVSETPNTTAYGFLHENTARLKYPFSILSEWKAAFDWIQVPYDPVLVEKVRSRRRAAAY